MGNTGYLEMLRNKVIPCSLEHNVLNKMIFMQHGAPPNIATEVKQFVKNLSMTNEYSAVTLHMNSHLAHRKHLIFGSGVTLSPEFFAIPHLL